MKTNKSLAQRKFSTIDGFGNRKAVCKKCHLIMSDIEPSGNAEFWHIASPHQTRALRCPNNKKKFDESSPEVEPFLTKALRRRYKRLNIQA